MEAGVQITLYVAILIAAVILSIAPAWALGSLRLDEVLLAVRSAPKLAPEIQAELDENRLTTDKVFCWAGRHGRHWKYLVGARSAPYSCKIGSRKLTIEADVIYFDSKGRNLGDVDHASPQKAKTFRQSNFRWKWTD